MTLLAVPYVPESRGVSGPVQPANSRRPDGVSEKALPQIEPTEGGLTVSSAERGFSSPDSARQSLRPAAWRRPRTKTVEHRPANVRFPTPGRSLRVSSSVREATSPSSTRDSDRITKPPSSSRQPVELCARRAGTGHAERDPRADPQGVLLRFGSRSRTGSIRHRHRLPRHPNLFRCASRPTTNAPRSGRGSASRIRLQNDDDVGVRFVQVRAAAEARESNARTTTIRPGSKLDRITCCCRHPAHRSRTLLRRRQVARQCGSVRLPVARSPDRFRE